MHRFSTEIKATWMRPSPFACRRTSLRAHRVWLCRRMVLDNAGRGRTPEAAAVERAPPRATCGGGGGVGSYDR